MKETCFRAPVERWVRNSEPNDVAISILSLSLAIERNTAKERISEYLEKIERERLRLFGCSSF
jgi:hypothetical protein